MCPVLIDCDVVFRDVVQHLQRSKGLQTKKNKRKMHSQGNSGLKEQGRKAREKLRERGVGSLRGRYERVEKAIQGKGNQEQQDEERREGKRRIDRNATRPETKDRKRQRRLCNIYPIIITTLEYLCEEMVTLMRDDSNGKRLTRGQRSTRRMVSADKSKSRSEDRRRDRVSKG